MALFSLGSSALTRSAVWMMLAPGWRWMSTMTAGLLLTHPARWTFSTSSTTSPMSLRRTGEPLTTLTMMSPKFGGGENLVVGADGVGLEAAVETAFGQIDVVEHQGAADIFHAEAQTGQGDGIDAHADGRLLVAFNGDQPDAGDLAEFLGQDGVGQIVDFGQRQFLGGELEGEDGGVGGVDLVEDGRVGHAGGEHAAGGVDGGLHVLGGGINVRGPG